MGLRQVGVLQGRQPGGVGGLSDVRASHAPGVAQVALVLPGAARDRDGAGGASVDGCCGPLTAIGSAERALGEPPPPVVDALGAGPEDPRHQREFQLAQNANLS